MCTLLRTVISKELFCFLRSCTRAGASPTINTGWGMKGLRAALRRRTWGSGGWKIRHYLPMCTRSTKKQPYPGLHPQNCGQQGNGGDSASLLCSCETPPRVLHPALEPTAQDRPGVVWAHPEEAPAMIRGLNPSAVRKVSESWGCSAWRR